MPVRATSPSAASSPPMWTCGICCQLAAMFATTAARSRSSGGAGVPGAAARSRATMRPPGPVPCTPASSTPCSRARRRAAGEAIGPPRRGVAVARSGPLGRRRAAAAAATGGGGATTVPARGLDLGEDAVHGDDLPLRGDDPQQPCLRRLDLHGRLVGLHLDDDLPGGDGVAVVDEPPAHLRLLHRDGELRDEQRGHATRRRTAATTSSALG